MADTKEQIPNTLTLSPKLKELYKERLKQELRIKLLAKKVEYLKKNAPYKIH